jgi:hypothetical protein
MSEVFEDLGRHGRYVPEPDGLEVRCKVCRQPKGEFCVNPVTGKPRRGGVSCIGRVERRPEVERG